MKLTVFTPTYNRGYLIEKLYNSLVVQTFKNFEWLIVDDGSTDDTEELCQQFIKEKKLRIKYEKQNNGGKHRAINNGVKKATGELFFIVDSDDQLVENALERIIFYYDKIRDNNDIGGICGVKILFSGRPPGGELPFSELTCNSLDFRHKYHIKGDMAEVFKTDILRDYPFPEYTNEKFCPEVLIWNRIAQKYKLLYFNENIYLCDYLEDGLTKKITNIRMKSPLATMDTYAELFSYDISIIQKMKACINYWRFSFNTDISFYRKTKRIKGLFNILCIPISYLMYLKDSHETKFNQKMI